MMTASAVKTYLSERHRASVTDVATHFGSSPDAARQVLGIWIAKGRVRAVVTAGCSGAPGCTCGRRPVEIYEWVN